MSFLDLVWARDITERTVLRILIVGFALVLLLLGFAGVLAVRATREFQSDADDLAREELTIARLLNEVQAEEAAMTAVLHHLVRHRRGRADARLIGDLDEADTLVRRAATVAASTADANDWRRLERAVAAFTGLARQLMAEPDRSDRDIEQLFTLHDQVIATVGHLVASSARRATTIDDLLAGRSRELASDAFALLGTCFLLSAVCAALTVRMAANTIQRLEAQSAELAEVSWQMVRTQEETARRFSHELHDELGQSLAAIKANLTAMRADDWDHRRADCIHVVDDAIGNVRELSQLLRPVLLDDFGLDAALRWLAEKFGQRTGIEVEYTSDVKRRLADETETHLFRIAQEALTNIGRHADATKVRVDLSDSHGRVELTITDNGRGLAVPEVRRSPSLGMVGMRTRARQAGGELRVATPPGGGLSIAVSVPLVYANDDTVQENSHTAG